MAYGAELTGAKPPVLFIYVWPCRDLIERSWSWPASWHEAFQDAASRIGLAVAIYLLDGSRLSRGLISLQLSSGLARFGLKRRGRSVFITVVEFTGPDAPGPDAPGPDGARQPSAVDGLILGLHGSGKNAYLVVFHGTMPIPAGALMPSADASRPHVLGISRTVDLQWPTANLIGSDNQHGDTRFAAGSSKPSAPANASGSGMLRFSPVLHFRLASGRPIYVVRPSGNKDGAGALRTHGRTGNEEPRSSKVSASKRKREILVADGIDMRTDNKAASERRLKPEHQLEMEKSPFRHLYSRYLH